MIFNTYHHTRTCLDEKIEIDEKISILFSAKKHFFVFCRKFGFNLEKLSNQYSQLKKQVKVDLETRSYDFLTKTREKNPMLPNIRKLEVTLGLRMIRKNYFQIKFPESVVHETILFL